MNFTLMNKPRIIETAVSAATFHDQDDDQLSSFFRTIGFLRPNEEARYEFKPPIRGHVQNGTKWTEDDIVPLTIFIKKMRKRRREVRHEKV